MSISSSEKKRRFITFSIFALLVGGFILGGSIMFLGPKGSVVNSSVKSARTDSVQGKAGGEGSEEYNKKIGEYDDNRASDALAAGDSFIPTPIGGRTNLERKQPEPAPVIQPITPAPVKPQTVQATRDNSAMLKRMMEDLAALDARLATASVGQGTVAYVRDLSRERASLQPNSGQGQNPVQDTAAALPVKVGDILYAVVDTGVNSDVPSAVMATVASGKMKNTRLLGKFQRFEERMVVAFSRAILPDGQDVQIEAYAIDPDTTEASVATDVDTRFFSRWGGLIAASFLEGLGEAKRYSGATSNIYGPTGTTDQMVWSNYSMADQAWIAAGKAGGKMSEIFTRNFDRPPTVYLAQGSPIGVLFMNVTERKQP